MYVHVPVNSGRSGTGRPRGLVANTPRTGPQTPARFWPDASSTQPVGNKSITQHKC